MQDFARAHNLSDTDLSWIYNTRNNLGNALTAEDRAQRKGAWSVIAQSLPDRTPKSVWAFATRVLHEGNYLVHHCVPLYTRSVLLTSLPSYAAYVLPVIRVFCAQASVSVGYCPVISFLNMKSPGQGKWSAEDTQRLLQLHAERGNKWKEIGAALGRHPENCRYKHRDLLLGEAERKGKWNSEEEAKLLDLVTQYIEERPVGHLLGLVF